MNHDAQRSFVKALLEEGLLVSPDILAMDGLTKEEVTTTLRRNNLPDHSFLVLTMDLYQAFLRPAGDSVSSFQDMDWLEFDGSRVLYEKKKNIKPYHAFLETLLPSSSPLPPVLEIPRPVQDIQHPVQHPQLAGVHIIKSYDEPGKKRGIKDFVAHYKHRYIFASGLLRHRPELQNVISIHRLKGKQPSEQIALIGLVYDKYVTKQGNVILTLEDPTGSYSVFINKEGPLKDILPYVTFDEVIGVSGSVKNNLLFANSLFFPDVSYDHKPKTTTDDVCAVFISDVHVGSRLFLEKEFLRFIDWLNGKTGNETQRALAQKVKYLFVVGDVIDGVGVYPGQESELLIKDIYDQYRRVKELLSFIREDIQIIMCPGNHDAVRIAEPQPRMNQFSEVLSGLKNLTLVSNPATVAVHKDEHNEGVDVLMYHGFSYDYYAASVEPIRAGGAYDRVDLIMKYLLQKRHLAPSHTSTQYVPSMTEDSLLIEKVPDIFVSGHVHKSSVNTYNGVLLVGCSCWQAKTGFQEKMGHHPDPGRVPVVNLKTRDVTIINFCDDLEMG